MQQKIQSPTVPHAPQYHGTNSVGLGLHELGSKNKRSLAYNLSLLYGTFLSLSQLSMTKVYIDLGYQECHSDRE